MNKLWNLEHYSAEALHRTVVRDGLRIRIHPQVHPFRFSAGCGRITRFRFG